MSERKDFERWYIDYQVRKDVKPSCWSTWQAARKATASVDFRAEIRTQRDVCDEYMSFLTFVVNGKTHPYILIPETLDDEVLEEALSRLNAHPPAKVPDDFLEALAQRADDCDITFEAVHDTGFGSPLRHSVGIEERVADWIRAQKGNFYSPPQEQ